MFITIVRSAVLSCLDPHTRCSTPSTRRCAYYPSSSVWCYQRCSDFNPAASRIRVTRRTVRGFTAIKSKELRTLSALNAHNRATSHNLQQEWRAVTSDTLIRTRSCAWDARSVKPVSCSMKWVMFKTRSEMLFRGGEKCVSVKRARKAAKVGRV